MDVRFAGNGPAPIEPSAAQVAELLDVLAAGDVRAAIRGSEGVLAHLRPVLAARDELQTRVSAKTLKAALELRRARVGPA